MDQVIIQRKIGSLLEANQYNVIYKRHALVFDACTSPKDGLPENTKLDAIILTHEHLDHICFANEWSSYYEAPIWCGKEAVVGLADPRLNMSHYGKAAFEVIDKRRSVNVEITEYSCIPDKILISGAFEWQDMNLQVIDTPGHSRGSICVLLNKKWLFCGDTLLLNEPTGIRFRGSCKKTLLDITFPKLKALDGRIRVFPGHGDGFMLENYKFWEKTT